jgi:hypothetical protein
MNGTSTHPVNDHRVRGHFFARSYLFIIFEDPVKGQYYFHEKTGWPIYKERLNDGEDWREAPEYFCCNPNADRIALHEAGHAAMCCLEGVKMEYVTIEPSDTLDDFARGALKRRKEGGGLCQWKYGIIEKRRSKTPAELLRWCEQEVKILLGGIMAEKRRYGPDEPPFHPEAWTSDEEMVKRRIDHLVAQTGSDADVDLERLVRAVESSFAHHVVWEGVFRIAQALVRRGAMPGREVERLFTG